jgi:DNA polymerase mu
LSPASGKLSADSVHLQPGAEYTLVGGYRRGKAESNDVDIVFTHPEDGKQRDALETLTATLKTAGYSEYVPQKPMRC